MATTAAMKIQLSRVFLVLAAFTLVFTSIFYLPSSGSLGRAQLKVATTAPVVAVKGATVDPLLAKHFSTSAKLTFIRRSVAVVVPATVESLVGNGSTVARALQNQQEG